MILDLPITLLAKELFLRVARPRSPILTAPEVPVMKMLSHLRSRCMMGGCLVCRKCRPFRIWRHQLRSTRFFTPLKRLRYLKVRKKQKVLRGTARIPFTDPSMKGMKICNFTGSVLRLNKNEHYTCFILALSIKVAGVKTYMYSKIVYFNYIVHISIINEYI